MPRNHAFRIVNWNVAWAVPGTARAAALRRRVLSRKPDIICITEGYVGYLPETGQVIAAGADYGYASPGGRRKVLLWSRSGWRDVDAVGDPRLPSGRYVSGITTVGGRDIQVLGLCIAWMNAHVATGRKDRRAWQDHLAYLEGLEAILGNKRDACIATGDFNQRIPRDRSPRDAYAALMRGLGGGFAVATRGAIARLGRPTVCHVAHTRDLAAQSVSGIDNRSAAGRLSDHFGLCVDFAEARQSA